MEEIKHFLDAVDVVCMECTGCSEENCKYCNVRKTVKSIIKMNIRRIEICLHQTSDHFVMEIEVPSKYDTEEYIDMFLSNITAIPNFDKEIFKEITGIDVDKD